MVLRWEDIFIHFSFNERLEVVSSELKIVMMILAEEAIQWILTSNVRVGEVWVTDSWGERALFFSWVSHC